MLHTEKLKLCHTCNMCTLGLYTSLKVVRGTCAIFMCSTQVFAFVQAAPFQSVFSMHTCIMYIYDTCTNFTVCYLHVQFYLHVCAAYIFFVNHIDMYTSIQLCWLCSLTLSVHACEGYIYIYIYTYILFKENSEVSARKKEKQYKQKKIRQFRLWRRGSWNLCNHRLSFLLLGPW